MAITALTIGEINAGPFEAIEAVISRVNTLDATDFTQMPVQAASVAADVATLVTDFNALLTKLKAAGLMASA